MGGVRATPGGVRTTRQPAGGTMPAVTVEREKQAAGSAAAALVEEGMTVGLGTGSTVA